MATILTLILIILPLFGYSHQNPGMTVPAPGESIDTPSREVVVQHPVTVQIADPSPMTTPPSMSALKTRVVVVHNNMVPVPIECFQPPDSGTCSKDLARIYYDHETRTCKPFSYTGCGGNANRFQSIKNCYRICHPYRYKIRPKVAHNKVAARQALKIRQIPVQQLSHPGAPAGGGRMRSLYGAPGQQQQQQQNYGSWDAQAAQAAQNYYGGQQQQQGASNYGFGMSPQQQQQQQAAANYYGGAGQQQQGAFQTQVFGGVGQQQQQQNYYDDPMNYGAQAQGAQAANYGAAASSAQAQSQAQAQNYAAAAQGAQSQAQAQNYAAAAQGAQSQAQAQNFAAAQAANYGSRGGIEIAGDPNKGSIYEKSAVMTPDGPKVKNQWVGDTDSKGLPNNSGKIGPN